MSSRIKSLPPSIEIALMVGMAVLFLGLEAYVMVVPPEYTIYEGNLTVITVRLDGVAHELDHYVIEGVFFIDYKDVKVPVFINITSASMVKWKDDYVLFDGNSDTLDFVAIQNTSQMVVDINIGNFRHVTAGFDAVKVLEWQNSSVEHEKKRILYAVAAVEAAIFASIVISVVYDRKKRWGMPKRWLWIVYLLEGIGGGFILYGELVGNSSIGGFGAITVFTGISLGILLVLSVGVKE